MHNATHIILAVLSMVIGVITTLTMVVMFLAGGANASQTHIRQLKWMIVSVLLVQALSLIGSIWLLIAHKGWPACGVGIFPLVYAIVLVTILVKIEW